MPSPPARLRWIRSAFARLVTSASAITERLREALGILEQKASPEELEAYKLFVVGVAESAAKAHKEGGFIGIGGKEVSESEQAALDEIRAVLGMTPD